MMINNDYTDDSEAVIASPAKQGVAISRMGLLRRLSAPRNDGMGGRYLEA